MRLLWNPTVMTFNFTVPEMQQSEGVQKVGGFSRGWHHKNSIRLGIRKESDYYALYLYAYVKGERIIKRIGNVYEEVNLEVKLQFKPRCVSVDVMFPSGNTFSKWHYFTSDYSLPIGYQLYPYAETDGKNPKRVPLNVKLNNVVIR